MKSIFARHGIADIVVSDNGPQYASAEFSSFAEEWGFKHVTSSPGYAQSNGQAERAVQTVKNLLKKVQSSHCDPYIALQHANGRDRIITCTITDGETSQDEATNIICIAYHGDNVASARAT